MSVALGPPQDGLSDAVLAQVALHLTQLRVLVIRRCANVSAEAKESLKKGTPHLQLLE